MEASMKARMQAATVLLSTAIAFAGCGVDLSFLDKDGGATDAGTQACQTADDCEALPHIECVGEWACADNTCVWNCTPPDKACSSDADCPEGLECVFDAVPVPMGGAEDAASPRCAGPGLKCVEPPQGVCKRNDPEVDCQDDADCPEGFHCEWPMPDTWEGDEPVAGGDSTKCSGLKCIPPSDGICVRDGECACYEIYDPVCGTDGLTYANDCFASCAGVAIAHWGECGTGCFGDADCGPGFRCDFSRPCAVDAGGDATDPADGSGSGGGMPACTGECIPVEQCRTDEDCLLVGGMPACDGTVECIGGQCVWQCNETCFEDADCGGGMRCVIDACPDCCPACDCDGRCFGHCAPVGGCYTDYDCAPGEQCVFMPCDCVDEDGDGVVEDCYESCKQGGGFCQPAPRCETDSDCGYGAACVIDVCADCAPDSTCEPGLECYCGCFGHCEPVQVQCYSNADCRPGEVCDATAYADMTGCCIPLDDGTGCPADYPMCAGVCRPAVCPAVACLMDCEYGFKVGPDGCELCECNEQPPKCETFTDPNGEVCTRCFNPDGSVTMSCGQSVCAMDQPACQSDFDCKGGAAGICMNGCCVFPGTCIETFAACKDDSMCPAGTACFDGACCYGLD